MFQTIPFDFHLRADRFRISAVTRSTSPSCSAPAASACAKSASPAAASVWWRFGLSLGIDIAIIGIFVDRRQSETVKLIGRAARSDGAGGANAAQQEQALAIRGPACSGGHQELRRSDHLFRSAVQLQHKDVAAQQL